MNIVYAFLAAVFAALPLLLVKEYWRTKNGIFILLSVLSFLCLIYTYIVLTERGKLSVFYPYLKIISILLVVSFGVFIFGEEINLFNAFGIILGSVSIILLSM
jgi:multidrug transporter EmrE-like cation transporter